MNMDEMLAAAQDCELTFPFVVAPDGSRIGAMRFHEAGTDPDNDMIVPLTPEDIEHVMKELHKLYGKLKAGNKA